ncbi:DUF1763-domain-containing protein [Nemania serpens]|nr:DUF1763-domain-containing protein [Nemania serpens]
MADLKIIHAYRHLYRGLLHAVQFSKPARYTALHQLRRAFREKGAKYDARGITRTVLFLRAAARERGIEHQVLRNLLIIAWYRYEDKPSWRQVQVEQTTPQKRTELQEHVQATVYKHYEMTIAMLNKSMGLCLR